MSCEDRIVELDENFSDCEVRFVVFGKDLTKHISSKMLQYNIEFRMQYETKLEFSFFIDKAFRPMIDGLEDEFLAKYKEQCKNGNT